LVCVIGISLTLDSGSVCWQNFKLNCGYYYKTIIFITFFHWMLKRHYVEHLQFVEMSTRSPSSTLTLVQYKKTIFNKLNKLIFINFYTGYTINVNVYLNDHVIKSVNKIYWIKQI
jgi:hypothetical protein